MAADAKSIGLACCAGLMGLAGGHAVAATAVEHYPPMVPAPVHPRQLIRFEPAPVPVLIPVGASLTGLSIAAPPGAEFTPATLDAIWQPYLGQPISPAMIGDIETAITARLTNEDRPLMARWAPDPAAPSGVLHFVLDDCKLETVTVTGGSPSSADAVKRRIGLAPGETVSGARLTRNLNSLNRYPFRQVSATFRPGKAADGYDLTLDETRTKPWQAYLGFKYSGSDQRTWRRYYAGATIGNLLGEDSVLAFQATGSPDAALHRARHPNFGDAYVTYTVPVTRNGIIEASLEGDEINFHIDPSDYRLQDALGGLGYRLDLPARGTAQRDVRAGIEARHERVYVTTAGVTEQFAIEVYQAYLGYHLAGDRATGHDDLDIAFRFSPGGVNGGDSSRNYVVYSTGREKTARYAYVYATYEGNGRLGPRFTWHSQVMGGLASAALPYTEQLPVGGMNYVRGYKLFDGTFDSALLVRQEIGLAHKNGEPAPYVFVDAGQGRDIGLKRTMTLASAGASVTVPLMASSNLNLYVVHTLKSGDVTTAGTTELEANLVFKY